MTKPDDPASSSGNPFLGMTDTAAALAAAARLKGRSSGKRYSPLDGPPPVSSKSDEIEENLIDQAIDLRIRKGLRERQLDSLAAVLLNTPGVKKPEHSLLGIFDETEPKGKPGARALFLKFLELLRGLPDLKDPITPADLTLPETTGLDPKHVQTFVTVEVAQVCRAAEQYGITAPDKVNLWLETISTYAPYAAASIRDYQKEKGGDTGGIRISRWAVAQGFNRLNAWDVAPDILESSVPEQPKATLAVVRHDEFIQWVRGQMTRTGQNLASVHGRLPTQIRALFSADRYEELCAAGNDAGHVPYNLFLAIQDAFAGLPDRPATPGERVWPFTEAAAPEPQPITLPGRVRASSRPKPSPSPRQAAPKPAAPYRPASKKAAGQMHGGFTAAAVAPPPDGGVPFAEFERRLRRQIDRTNQGLIVVYWALTPVMRDRYPYDTTFKQLCTRGDDAGTVPSDLARAVLAAYKTLPECQAPAP